MRRWIGFLVLALCLTGLPVRATDVEAAGELEKWFLTLQTGGTWRSERNVFGRYTLDGEVENTTDDGLGFAVGRRIGDRFLLAGQVTAFRHSISDSEDRMIDVEALITGTVLYRERDTLQPFLRGGFGAGGQVLDLQSDDGALTVFGTSAVAGGGLQVLFNHRFSFEVEGVFTFTNFLQVEDDTDSNLGGDENSWQVRRSAWGTRFGLGLSVWF